MTVLGGAFKNIVRGGHCVLCISNRMTVAMYLCDLSKRDRGCWFAGKRVVVDAVSSEPVSAKCV